MYFYADVIAEVEKQPEASKTCFCDDHGKIYFCEDGCPICGKH